jgi:hypothetical protein
LVQPPEGVRVTKNVVFLFDCSTSMSRANRFAKAVQEINQVLSYPLDDGMFSLIGFRKGRSYYVWPGFNEEDDPKPAPHGWAKLPSLNAIQNANRYLNGVRCQGWTDIGSAIQKVFSDNQNREEVTIILFTDGNNTFPSYNGKKPSEVAATIRALNETRKKAQKDKIRIFVFGLSAEQNVKMLTTIAQEGGGGYLTTDIPCAICLKTKRNSDVPEIQRYHRVGHCMECVKHWDTFIDDDEFRPFHQRGHINDEEEAPDLEEDEAPDLPPDDLPIPPFPIPGPY